MGRQKQPYVFFIEEWVESAVVTMGRILYTLNYKTIVSKDRVAILIRTFSGRVGAFIKEVARIRQNPKEKNALKVEKGRYDEEVLTAFD